MATGGHAVHGGAYTGRGRSWRTGLIPTEGTSPRTRCSTRMGSTPPGSQERHRTCREVQGAYRPGVPLPVLFQNFRPLSLYPHALRAVMRTHLAAWPSPSGVRVMSSGASEGPASSRRLRALSARAVLPAWHWARRGEEGRRTGACMSVGTQGDRCAGGARPHGWCMSAATRREDARGWG